MARKTFFSFHFERDSWRAGQVRNSNVIPVECETGFMDACDWKEVKKQGDDAIELWIASQLEGTSVAAVLIGAETADRPWVQHEIIESWNRGNGLVGVLIHNIKDVDGNTDSPGRNPLHEIRLPDGTSLGSICRTYDWVTDDGRANLGSWIGEAYQLRKDGGITDSVKDNSGVKAYIAKQYPRAAQSGANHSHSAGSMVLFNVFGAR
jgi:hypothetical protein